MRIENSLLKQKLFQQIVMAMLCGFVSIIYELGTFFSLSKIDTKAKNQEYYHNLCIWKKRPLTHKEVNVYKAYLQDTRKSPCMGCPGCSQYR